jgi:predicted AAA+ superfamily ATPase
MKSNLKRRDWYVDKLSTLRDPELVKVITGVRRCGKSKLLELFALRLSKEGVPANHILTINFEKREYAPLLEGSGAFEDYVETRLPQDVHCYLFVDEVQELRDWAKAINSIRASFAADIYVTGSNSQIFSGEHLTYLSGRYVEVRMLPLSFKEFLNFKGYPTGERTERHFDEYLRVGSFPALALTDNQEIIDAITAGLNDSILSRDIVLRGKIRNEANFYKVAKFVCDNIGSQTSAHNIANTLKSQGHRISTDSVDAYLKLMCDAHLLYQCERYDIRGRERLRTNGKYYVVDTGLRNRLLGYRTSDLGHEAENIVYLQLLRLGYEVSTGIVSGVSGGEADFVATRGTERVYFQVSQSVVDPAVLKRELKPLLSIKDNYRKYLVTLDDLDYSTEGIQHLNLMDFLLQEA